MKNIAIFLISLYQKLLSPDTGLPKKLGLVRRPVCPLYPTCSEYTKIAISIHGFTKGSYLGAKRILRCYPGREPSVDMVPEKKEKIL